MLGAFRDLLHAGSRAEILRILADTAVDEVGADGAAIVEVTPGGLGRVVEARHLPAEITGWEGQVLALDETLGARLLAETAGAFGCARTVIIVNGGGPFGALVLFFAEPRAIRASALPLGEALAALAAIELDKEHQLTELRASREVLERTDKLRAMGEMAAGISHDLKNLLNPLSLHLQLLQRILRRGGPGAEEAIAEMSQVLRRGVETLERLREFSRQSPETSLETVALDALAHEALELCRPRIASTRRAQGIRLVEDRQAPPPIQARSSELVAALVNLVANAIDALADGGTVTVRTGAEAGGAWVQVEDDGPGMSDEVKARIFEPFFTTKGQAGTGLGLAMVFASVQRYGGKLTLDTAPGRGARFRLWFPAAPP